MPNYFNRSTEEFLLPEPGLQGKQQEKVERITIDELSGIHSIQLPKLGSGIQKLDDIAAKGSVTVSICGIPGTDMRVHSRPIINAVPVAALCVEAINTPACTTM